MRTLVDLLDSQVQALNEMSRQEKRSRAALIRQAIDQFLASRQSSTGEPDAFGLWKTHEKDGLEYQDDLRREW
jgi:metal-responsive CopG/Arc/MetJ family transcriptional regulator